MRLATSFLLASTMLVPSVAVANEDFNVVASIKPIHSLVAAVMEGVGEPGLVVKGAGSPHTYSMRPSEATMLQDADLVFWVGHDLEPFLEGPIENLAASAKTVELMDAHDLVKLEFREGGAFDDHGHGDDSDEHADASHAHDDHDDHSHKEKTESRHGHNDQGHEAEAEAKHDHDDGGHAEHGDDDHGDHSDQAETKHDDHADHDHGEFDPHIWLDPLNAKALVHEIEEALAEADPEHAATYEANAQAVMAKLDILIGDVGTELAGLSGKGFVVFHDAYRYFEERFGLEATGSITVSPEIMPGAARVAELRENVEELGATCIFSEPQFEPKIVQTLVDGTSARSGVLDPLGADLNAGPDLYFALIRNMASSFGTCLGGQS